MCGICGHSADPDGTSVRLMNAALHHRGPDDTGVFVDGEMALGATRLSIIDVEGGHQPIPNEDGSVVAALNGELYNHPALRRQLEARGHRFTTRCDTEVLVHLYEEYGDDLVHALDGMYAFAIWDARRRRLLLARDRYGEKPLFFAERQSRLVFASELTALLAGGVTGEVDEAAIDAFFVLGYVPGPTSLIRGVEQLAPGTTLVFEDGRLTRRAYWRPPVYGATVEDDADELARELEHLLLDSVRSRMIADVPLGVFLSGGTDSTLVASLAAEVSPHAVKTFTVGYDVGGVSEADPARAGAARLGTEHHELVLQTRQVEPLTRELYAGLDQPIADQALLASHAVARFARESVKVVVGGEGADELFGGYPRYRWLARADRIGGPLPAPAGELGAAVVRRIAGGRRAERLADVVAPVAPAQRHLNWVTGGRAAARARFYGPRLQAGFGAAYIEERMGEQTNGARVDVARRFMLHDQDLWLPDDVLAKADRASMLASLEVRTPFLHPALAEFAAGVPTRTHLRDDGKALLRAVLDRRLGTRQRRPKVAFRVPADAWLRGPLEPLLREQLAAGQLYREGFVDAKETGAALDEHVAGRRDWTPVLWPLMALGLWMDRIGA